MHGAAGHVQCCFCLVFEFLDGEDQVNVGSIFEMAFDARQLLVNVVTDRRRNFYVMACQIYLHMLSSVSR